MLSIHVKPDVPFWLKLTSFKMEFKVIYKISQNSNL